MDTVSNTSIFVKRYSPSCRRYNQLIYIAFKPTNRLLSVSRNLPEEWRFLDLALSIFDHELPFGFKVQYI
jgi:hypothetical protein